jgi:hypothetical protein
MIPFADKLHQAVICASETAAAVRIIGVTDCTENGLLINITSLAMFLNIQNRSLLKDLRQHGFQRQTSFNPTQEIRVLFPDLEPEAKMWSKWTNMVRPFNRWTLIADAQRLSNDAKHIRSSRRPARQPDIDRESRIEPSFALEQEWNDDDEYFEQ